MVVDDERAKHRSRVELGGRMSRRPRPRKREHEPNRSRRAGIAPQLIPQELRSHVGAHGGIPDLDEERASRGPSAGIRGPCAVDEPRGDRADRRRTFGHQELHVAASLSSPPPRYRSAISATTDAKRSGSVSGGHGESGCSSGPSSIML